MRQGFAFKCQPQPGDIIGWIKQGKRYSGELIYLEPDNSMLVECPFNGPIIILPSQLKFHRTQDGRLYTY
jgi:hypothetical protein